MKKFILLLICPVLFLTACNNAESEFNDFYDEFTKSLDEEQELSALNDEYNELESTKASLQEELNNAAIEEINEISQQLKDNTSARLELLEKERELMASSNETFEGARESVENISDEDYKQKAESLVTSMDNRYGAHGTLTDNYVHALESEQELFEYLAGEDITQDTIDEHLNTIAEYNEPINDAAISFTAETEKVNQLKNEIEQILENN